MPSRRNPLFWQYRGIQHPTLEDPEPWKVVKRWEHVVKSRSTCGQHLADVDQYGQMLTLFCEINQNNLI